MYLFPVSQCLILPMVALSKLGVVYGFVAFGQRKLFKNTSITGHWVLFQTGACIFSCTTTVSNTDVRPTQYTYKGLPLGLCWTESEANHQPPCNAEV